MQSVRIYVISAEGSRKILPNTRRLLPPSLWNVETSNIASQESIGIYRTSEKICHSGYTLYPRVPIMIARVIRRGNLNFKYVDDFERRVSWKFLTGWKFINSSVVLTLEIKRQTTKSTSATDIRCYRIYSVATLSTRSFINGWKHH